MMRVKNSLALMLRVAFLLVCSLNVAYAGEPPTEPMLRIDPGEHIVQINRIATDRDGRWLVTASNDKTARVWSLEDGRLLATLRVPIAGGHEGKLYTVAMSPDGQTVALGGWTQAGEEASVSIYLFDRASGRMLRRLPGLLGSISSLAFSPDGQTLAATLSGGAGLHLFSVSDGRALAEDIEYDTDSYSVHFTGDGRLVTTCLDGFLRLYRFDGANLTLLAKKSAPGGKQPFTARFSPDGQRIAVIFNDSFAVNVLNSSDLSFAYAPETAKVDAELMTVAWSRDGETLFAAGDARHVIKRYIRRWRARGTGSAQEWNTTQMTVVDLAPLPDGKLVYATGMPEWGVFSADGTQQLFHGAPIADLRDNLAGFKLSADGKKVLFGFELYGKSPAVFDIQNRAFANADSPGLSSPTIKSPGLELSDWINSATPKLNGTVVEMKQYETSRSLAILPGGDGFVLGAEWSLRCFDRNGKQRWVQESEAGIAWDVNVSQDGRWVVVAYADGTIRWHRAADGVEQLAFYPHPDKKRWVMWTPSGYFEASPGAEDFIGWHVNRGKDHAPDFFPASRFRDRFNRPDILAKVLETQDEAKAISLANAESGRRTSTASIAQVLPPVVEIVSPASDSSVDSTTIKVRYTVRTAADAPVTAMRVRVNGLLQSDTRALKLVSSVSDTQEIEVKLPEQDAEVQLFAENKYSVSTPAILRLKWAGKVSGQRAKPKLYVLAVGVSKYKNPDYNLGLAAKDAQDFVSALESQKGKLYDDVVVRLLTDDKATKDDVLDGLDWLKQQVTAQDVGIMFVAGHGMNDKLGGYFFLPHNADPEKLNRTGVSQDDIKRTFASLPGKTVFFVDTCFSGSVLGTVRTSGFINDMASAENGAVVFAASSAGQLSQENESWGNGAFTKSVVEGLSGKADFRKKGLITAKGLDYYVDDRVRELTNGLQTPVSIAPGGVSDFTLASLGAQSDAETASSGSVAVPVPAPTPKISTGMQPGTIYKDCADCPEMVVIPAGSFNMGTAAGRDAEAPVHQVTFAKPFAMGKIEITQAQWQSVMGNLPNENQNCGDNCPVGNISWNEAQEFIQKLNAKTGKQYRLPSEAEWEYACRAGGQQEYCGSGDVGDVGWYESNSGDTPHPAAQKAANAFGLYDMSGSLWEYVEDTYHDSYSGAPTDGTAWTGDGAERVIRSGSWNASASFERAAYRMGYSPKLQFKTMGMRVAQALSGAAAIAIPAPVPPQVSAAITSGSVFKDCADCPEMVLVPAGSFDMGSRQNETERYDSESPLHRVTIGNAFALGKTEVTQGQWKAVMGDNPSGFTSCGDNCPVEKVGWNDAKEFVRKLSAKTGQQYRLPSEAEWEYACRAGGQQKYCGSDTQRDVAWYGDNSPRRTSPVAQKQANAFGLYDMSGNVWEWVEDSMHADYNGAPSDGSAWSEEGAKRLFRGGSWYSPLPYLNKTTRLGDLPTYRDDSVGFRVARAVTAPTSAAAASVAGTTWAIKDSDGDQYLYFFQTDGALHYQGSNKTLYKNGTWQQSANKISMEANQRYMEREGEISGKHASGNGWNRQGEKWTWTADQVD
ncbi:MAG: SUMF1/EgtB/PvdO family nonheme iron enzyme [Sideroxydans sp.]|nr:SUMF1/EgtB/PvdO family nonheme iron enzyme [Sideroxydans sp.]